MYIYITVNMGDFNPRSPRLTFWTTYRCFRPSCLEILEQIHLDIIRKSMSGCDRQLNLLRGRPPHLQRDVWLLTSSPQRAQKPIETIYRYTFTSIVQQEKFCERRVVEGGLWARSQQARVIEPYHMTQGFAYPRSEPRCLRLLSPIHHVHD
jgi:hypothetical protein